MPSQLIPFTVMRSPAGDLHYNQDIVGVIVPLFYHDVEAYGNLFSYLPYEFRLGRYAEQMILADSLHQDNRIAQAYKHYTADKVKRKHAVEQFLLDATTEQTRHFEFLKNNLADSTGQKRDFKYERLYQAGKFNLTTGTKEETMLADKQAISTVIEKSELLRADKFVYYKEILSIATMKAEPVIEQKETTVSTHLEGDIAVLYKDSVIENTVHQAEVKVFSDATISWLLQAVEQVKDSGALSKITYGSLVVERKQGELSTITLVELRENILEELRIVYSVKALKASRIDEEMIGSERDDKGGHESKQITFSEKALHGGYERHPDLDSFAEREPKSTMLKKLFSFADRDGKSTMRVFPNVLAVRTRKASSIFTEEMLLEADRSGKGAKLMDILSLDVIRKVREGRFEELEGAELISRDINMTAKSIAAILDYRDAYVDRNMLFGKNTPRDSQVIEDALLATFSSREAMIQRVVLEMQKHGVLARFVSLILSDDGIRDSRILEKIVAESKVERDSFMHESTLFDGKNERNTLLQKIIYMVKSPKNSGWIAETTFAIMHDRTKQAVLEYLEQADNPSIEGLLETLKESELAEPEKQALISELKGGWNRDKPNRPAGVVPHPKLGHWDIGWDDVMGQWEPGWDYLSVPGRDYDYEQFQDKLYNEETGEPYNPLSPVNEPIVEIEAPAKHPFAEWAEVGKKESWVEIFTFQDIIINILGIQRENTLKIAGMTTHQALQFILRELYIILERADRLNDEYQRMFRFVRWYAEMITMKESTTVLYRKYNDWTDRIVQDGKFNGAHSKGNMVIQSNGVIESTSKQGSFAFSLRTDVKTSITFSCQMALTTGSTGKLLFFVDGELVKEYNTNGIFRDTFELEEGLHQYQFNYDIGNGEIIRLSGLVITNAYFVEAYTEQMDNTETNGLRSINALVQELTSYYIKHHLNKKKGSMQVRQRKIWLN